jgi:hypothetical protein
MDEQARLGKKQTTSTVSINGSFTFKAALGDRDLLDDIYMDMFKLAKAFEKDGVFVEQFSVNYHNYNFWSEMYEQGEEEEEPDPISGDVAVDVEAKD